MERSTAEIYDLIVVGGGAAGFFGAIQAGEMKSGLKTLILEKSNKILSKVKISGGGRCNVTHDCLDAIQLSHHYPRGEKFLQPIFKTYDVGKTISWFESKGIKIKKEVDGRMFPATDDSQTIIDCFVKEALRLNIKIELGEGVVSVEKESGLFKITSVTNKKFLGRNLLITTGGNPKTESYQWIRNLGHSIIPPIPSLFTFNDSEKRFTDLMGLSVPNGEVRIAGTKLFQTGPVLITHWGLSGPAVIKLSAWAAEHLHKMNYNFTALVSWIGSIPEKEISAQLTEQKTTRGKQKVFANPLYALPQRLWLRLCELAEIEETKIWAELPQKNINKLMELLIRCPFRIQGKTTFKDEFVTCGGVDLKEVDARTMESKIIPGVYFAGEILNIDGETGGFNFQNAWSTSYIAALAISAL